MGRHSRHYYCAITATYPCGSNYDMGAQLYGIRIPYREKEMLTSPYWKTMSQFLCE